RWAALVPKDPVAECDEFGACCREWCDLVHAAGIAHAGDLEHFRPPRHALDHGLERGPVPPLLQLAEHHVVGTQFGRHHGVVPGGKPTAAGDPCRLERCERTLECIDAAEMCAVGASPGRNVGAPVEQEGGASVLYHGRESLGAVDSAAFI